MNRVSLAAAALLAVPAAARAGDVDFEDRLRAIRQAAHEGREASEKAARARDEAVRSVLTSMNDGNPAGEAAVAALGAAGIGVRIEPQEPRVRVAPGPGNKRYVILADSLPKYPRVLGPYVAGEATRIRHAAMPDCAEREYMAGSAMARTWIELGGEPSGLPVIEPLTGWRDAQLSATLKSWLAYAPEMALYRISQETGRPRLPELIDREQRALDACLERGCPEGAGEHRKRLAEYAKANDAFVDSLLEELNWRQLYQGRF